MSHADPESLFAAWAERAEAGEPADFDALLAAHPHLAGDLRAMHADWQLFAPILERVVPGLIASDMGLAPGPLSMDAESSQQPVSRELVERLGIQLPDTGRYRFRGVLGRGGGGVVLRVWDKKLHRPLAMKVVLGRGETKPTGDTPPVDAQVMTRFVDEARIASQLDHPGIVPVHELGTDSTGRAFFTMRLVKGDDLSKIFAKVKTGEDGWTQVRALGVLAKVCEAVAYAHEKGVVHRDLKPANVMVGRHGEVHVMDWGLARVRGTALPVLQKSEMHSHVESVRAGERNATPDSPLLTRDGSVVGTPAYMAPEQARGELDRVDARSDVYAIGAMLYELLTGCVPFVPAGTNGTAGMILMRVLEGPPVPVSRLTPHLPPELIAICDMAMNRQPEGRYPDVKALEQDLSAYLERRVVHAYRTGPLPEFLMWMRRNKSLATTALIAALALVIGAACTSVFAVLAAKRQEVLQEKLVEGSWAAFNLADRQLEIPRDDASASSQESRSEGLLHLARAIELYPDNALAWERLISEAVEHASYYGRGRRLQHAGQVLRTSFSASGALVVAAGNGRVTIWDANTCQLLRSLPQDGRVSGAKFACNDALLLSFGKKFVSIWSTDTWKLLASLPQEEDVSDAFASNDQSRVLVALDTHCKLVDIQSGAVVSRFDHSHRIGEVQGGCICAFSHDGKRLVTAGDDGVASVWDASDGGKVASFRHEHPIMCAAFFPDGKSILVGPYKSNLTAWSIADKARLFEIGEDRCQEVSVSSDGRYILTTSDLAARAVNVWNGLNGALISAIRSDNCWGSSFSPDAYSVVTAGDNGVALVSEVETGRVVARLQHEDKVLSVAFNGDGSRIVTGGNDGFARIWEFAPPRPCLTVPCGDTGRLGEVDAGVLPDGSHIILSRSAADTCVISTETGVITPLHCNAVLPTDDYAMDGSNMGGSLVLLPCREGALLVFEHGDWKCIAKIDNEREGRLSPDGSLALTSRGDESQRLWCVAEGGVLCSNLRRWSLSHDWSVGAAMEGEHCVVYDTRSRRIRWRVPYAGRIWVHGLSRMGDLLATVLVEDKPGRVGGPPPPPPEFRANELTIWDTKTLAALWSRRGEGPLSFSFSPNGSLVEVSSAAEWALLDSRTGEVKITLQSSPATVGFSPDSRWIIIIKENRETVIWSLDSFRPLSAEIGGWDGEAMWASGACIEPEHGAISLPSGQPLLLPFARTYAALASPKGNRILLSGPCKLGDNLGLCVRDTLAGKTTAMLERGSADPIYVGDEGDFCLVRDGCLEFHGPWSRVAGGSKASRADVGVAMAVAQLLTQRKLSGDGIVESISAAEESQAMDALRGAMREPNRLRDLAAWVLQTGPDGPAFVGASVSRREWVEILRSVGYPLNDTEAYWWNPLDPLVRISLAGHFYAKPAEGQSVEGLSMRRQSLREFGVRGLPMDENIRRSARDMLQRQGEALDVMLVSESLSARDRETLEGESRALHLLTEACQMRR